MSFKSSFSASAKNLVDILLLMIWVRIKSFLAKQSLICSNMNSTFSFFSIEPNVSTWRSCNTAAAPSISPWDSLIRASSLVKRALSVST
ncbi:unnamed protein product [Schistosoma margrebowiei]|uniref:Uncharacterized protein n=1 Tax=Schistosoma margrebowiei TaxID=48269 RepID=A0A3P8ADK5_9TREM|nr:unnamed protein product [Schistosoma margrebowiei]